MGKYALLIGVSEYAGGLTALPAATQDAAALQRVLQAPDLGAFDDVQLLANPSCDEMARTIELWLAARQTDDLALLFFSGHGIKDDRRKLHFAAENTQKVSERLTRSTAFAAHSLCDYLGDCRSRQQVVILDCCFSGAFGELLPRDDGNISLEEQLVAEGRVVLASTSSVDYAFEEKESDLSVYTRYLVEGIEKGTADKNGDGIITIDELHEFASRKVRETAPAMSPKIITLEGQGYKIELARAPQGKPELKYRKEVEKRVRNGQFTIPARRMLTSLQQRYGLNKTAAEAIEEEVLKPFRDYQRKLTEYRNVLAECLKEGTNLEPDALADLKDYQKYLGLKNEDIQPIEKDLVGHLLGLKPQPAANINNTEKGKNKTPSGGQYSTFSFESVQVNAKGEIVQTMRSESECLTEVLGNGLTLEMVRIPSGTFLMGAAQGEDGASRDEYPQHEVTVPEFWMGKYAITQAQWSAIATQKKIEHNLSQDPSRFKGSQRPVERVSWQDAIEFCKRLSQVIGRDYCLPSEAQWEYACRAHTSTPFHFGATITPDLANYRGNVTYREEVRGTYYNRTTEVGSFSPNGFGLYDMHGNVWEWCLDGWHGSYQNAPTDGSTWQSSDEAKLLRGGSWFNNPAYCRAANRLQNSVNLQDNVIGFRVVCFACRESE